MKKVAVITVAGASTRFRESLGKDVLKCIYSDGDKTRTILYTLTDLCKDFDSIVIVGGYKFSELNEFIKTNLNPLSDKIALVENTHYIDYGSGYSLYLGLQKAQSLNADEVLFTEGDLFFDRETFEKIICCRKNVITANNEHIDAKKSVAFYIDESGTVKYIYDTSHSSLFIDEAFLAIYNSGQVWKFIDCKRLFQIMQNLNEKEKRGTNLIIVQQYFSSLSETEYEVIDFKKWINCNTVDDYLKAREASK